MAAGHSIASHVHAESMEMERALVSFGQHFPREPWYSFLDILPALVITVFAPFLLDRLHEFVVFFRHKFPQDVAARREQVKSVTFVVIHHK